jgi:hypothetical protein
MVSGLALLLLLRRWSDALHKPLGSFGLILLAMTLCGAAIGARLLWYAVQRWQDAARSRLAWFFDALLTAGVLGTAAAVSLPESPVLATAMLWLVALGVESAAWFLRVRGERTFRAATRAPAGDGEPESAVAEQAACRVPQPNLADDVAAEWQEEEESFETLPPGVSQRVTRGRDDSAGEMVYGLIRCDFEPGQRQQIVHVAFCPPLQQAPQLSLDQVGGPTARLRPAVVEPFGAGVEVKLKAASSEPSSVQIQFYACERRRSG